MSYSCLKFSISIFKKIYGEKFRYIVCHNNCDTNLLPQDIELIDQSKINKVSSKFGNVWKLVPPRLEIGTHEIFIDNDLIIYENIKQIGKFIESTNAAIATEALSNNQNSYSNHLAGMFLKKDKEAPLINSGFFGIPPHFDLNAEIQKRHTGKWNGCFDEQGLVNLVLTECLDLEIIGLDQIWITDKEFKIGKSGMHFVGLNSGKSLMYKKFRKMFLI